jgi:hypothetical protein
MKEITLNHFGHSFQVSLDLDKPLTLDSSALGLRLWQVNLNDIQARIQRQLTEHYPFVSAFTEELRKTTGTVEMFLDPVNDQVMVFVRNNPAPRFVRACDNDDRDDDDSEYDINGYGYVGAENYSDNGIYLPRGDVDYSEGLKHSCEEPSRFLAYCFDDYLDQCHYSTDIEYLVERLADSKFFESLRLISDDITGDESTALCELAKGALRQIKLNEENRLAWFNRGRSFTPDVMLTIPIHYDKLLAIEAFYFTEVNDKIYLFGFPYNTHESHNICKGNISGVNSFASLAHWMTGICNHDLCSSVHQHAASMTDGLLRAGLFHADDGQGLKVTPLELILNTYYKAYDDDCAINLRAYPLDRSVLVPIAAGEAFVNIGHTDPGRAINHALLGPPPIPSRPYWRIARSFVFDNALFYAVPGATGRDWIFSSNGDLIGQDDAPNLTTLS